MNYIGIDIGGTRLKAGLVNESGKVLNSEAVATPTSIEPFTEALRSLAARVAASAGSDIAVGIGCKGVVNPHTRTVEVQPGTFSFLEGLDLEKAVRPVFAENTPIFADNDARVALFGEMMWGAARGCRNAIMLTLGTGLGGAVLAEGNVLRGVNGVAGHLGHLSIDAEGNICICGNRGCLESYFSARAIEAAALQIIWRGCESALTDKFAARPNEITCRDVFEIAAGGDDAAQVIIREAITKLAAVLAGLLHSLDPEIVIIGGQIAEAGDQLFVPLRQEIEWRTKRWMRREVPIVPPQVTDSSGIAGAAALAISSLTESRSSV